MDMPLFLLLEGILFIVVFQGMNLLRQEGFSGQSALEVLVLSGLAAGLAWATGFIVHPILLLVVIYLVSMRTRLLVDLANLFARQNQFAQAERFYSWAEHLGPDPAGRGIVALNRATALLFQDKLEGARTGFKAILENAKQNRLGNKYQAAAHYNLGVIYRKQGSEAQARSEFDTVMEILPVSEYGRLARMALRKQE
jgi:tetratricopeptide (TPR) repeat protein